MKQPKAEPKTRKRPDFSGVPGEIVSVDGLGLTFVSKLRISPYNRLLDELEKATNLAVNRGKERPALRFGDVKARASVNIRAKRKGFHVTFAEHSGALYVRIDGCEAEDLKGSRRERILGALRVQPGLTSMRLTVLLREKGDSTLDAQIMESILTQMVRAGEVVKIEGEGYRLNPARPKAVA